MIFSPIRLVLMVIGAAVGLVVVLGAVVLVAAFAGSPGECDSGDREIEFSPALAEQLQAKLDDLDAQLDAGQAASITFDESEATSRGRRFLDEENAPVADLKICLNPDGPSASGSLEAVLGLDVTAKVSGDLFLDGEHPRVDNLDIDVGTVPGFAAGGFEGVVEDVINDQLEHISLEHQLTITFGEGMATLSGQP
ncbi:MAG TPA: hypothetical protein VJ578_03585 [Dehalococcoidia bacterium]|nr:hypothetical protein [Dehalococcoidia bacterium]